MSNNRTLSIVCAGLGLAIFSYAEASLAQDKQVIRYHEYPGSVSHLVQKVMVEKGICDKQGIRCEPVHIASGPLAAQAAAAGSLDIMISSTDQIMQAIAKGNDLQIVATQMPNHIFSLFVSKDLPQPNRALGYPAKMRDFKGAKIGVSARGSGTEMIAKALLSGAGISPDSATYVAVGAPPTAYPALAVKQIDAALNWDPMPAICAATGECSIAVDLRKGEGPEELMAMNGGYNSWAARREFIQKNEAAVDAFARALAEAMVWVKDPANSAEALELAKKHFKLSDSIPNRDQVLEQTVKDMISMYGVKFDRRAVKGFNDFLIKNRLIDKPLDAKEIVYRNAP